MAEKKSTGMVIDGAACVEVFDKSGELLVIEGADFSSVDDGKVPLSFEHDGADGRTPSPLNTVGVVTSYHKIWGSKDCENERQEAYWGRIKHPFVYITGRLYDGAGHPGAIALAASIRDHVANGEPPMMEYSVEGATTLQEGQKLLETIVRKVTITVKPCNALATSGLLEDPKAPDGFAKVKQPPPDLLVEKAEVEGGRRLGGSSVVISPVLEDNLAKTLTAGATGMTAPGNLTGGAALQREDSNLRLRHLNMAKTVLRDYKSDSGMSLRDFAKAQLPSASDEFLDHFEEMVEELRVKLRKGEVVDPGSRFFQDRMQVRDAQNKATAFANQPQPPVGNKVATGLRTQKDMYDYTHLLPQEQRDVGDRLVVAHRLGQHDDYMVAQHLKDGKTLASDWAYPEGAAKDAQSTPLRQALHAHGQWAKWHMYDFLRKAEGETGKGPGDGGLTYRGKPVPAGKVGRGQTHLDPDAGELHLDNGSFKLHNPDEDPENPKSGDAFRHIWRSKRVRDVHDYAVRNWIKLNHSLRTGRTPKAVLATAAAFSTLSTNCLDAETEALTQRGWIKGFDLALDDVLLTKNIYSGILEWQPLSDLRLFPDYEGPLVEFKSRSFNAVSTPDHRWMVTSGRGIVKEKVSKDIKNGDHIHRTGRYLGPQDSLLTPDEAELLGWFVTDGSIRKPYPHLERTGKDFSRYDNSTSSARQCDRWRLGAELTNKLLALAPDRILRVDALTKLNRAALERLYEAILMGDGSSWSEKGWSKKETVVTGRSEQASSIQALLVLLGESSSCIWRDMSKYSPKSPKMRNIPKMTGCFNVTKHQRDVATLEPHQVRSIAKSRTPVWCPIVPNTFFVARRRGQVFITGNTPVGPHEHQFGFLLDTQKAKGVDPRSPKFGSQEVLDDWLARDRPFGVPQHSTDYFLFDIPHLLEVQNPSKDPNERQPGENIPFMLANDKFERLARYHEHHQTMADVVRRHGTDGRAAVQDLMDVKRAHETHRAKRYRDVKQGKPDRGPLTGEPAVYGLAQKTARFAVAMVGAGNMIVPDTHMVRHLFGLDKSVDTSSIENIKSKALWNIGRSDILSNVDKWYFKNHPAVDLMLKHPEFKDYFKDDPEQAIFPAFWGHWLCIAEHENWLQHSHAGQASNQQAYHKPYFEEVQRIADDPTESKDVVGQKSIFARMRKSEDSPLIHPHLAAALLHGWVEKHGEAVAMQKYLSHLLPLLMHSPPMERPSSLVRAEGLIVELGRMVSLLKAEAPQGSVTAPMKKPTPSNRVPCPNECSDGVESNGEICYTCGGRGDVHKDTGKLAPPVRGQPIVDADIHGHPHLNTSKEQHALVHGMNPDFMAEEPIGAQLGVNRPSWTHTGDGRLAVMKAGVVHKPDGLIDFTFDARGVPDKEVQYHNLARDFFGMGDFVPTTATFTHPRTGVQHSVQEAVPDGEHLELKRTFSGDHFPHIPEHREWLQTHFNSGDLDKLALMNIIMGNGDRRDPNFLVTPHYPHVRMIDHSHAFAAYGHTGFSAGIPAYMHRAGQVVDKDSDITMKNPIHPGAWSWISQLDHKAMAAQMGKMGMDAESIAHATGALLAIQGRLAKNPQESRQSLYNTPDIRYTPSEAAK